MKYNCHKRIALLRQYSLMFDSTSKRQVFVGLAVMNNTLINKPVFSIVHTKQCFRIFGPETNLITTDVGDLFVIDLNLVINSSPGYLLIIWEMFCFVLKKDVLSKI